MPPSFCSHCPLPSRRRPWPLSPRQNSIWAFAGTSAPQQLRLLISNTRTSFLALEGLLILKLLMSLGSWQLLAYRVPWLRVICQFSHWILDQVNMQMTHWEQTDSSVPDRVEWCGDRSAQVWGSHTAPPPAGQLPQPLGASAFF